MGYLKSVGTAFIYIALFLAVITFIPGLPPEAEFSEYSAVLPSDVEQKFELKNRLWGAEALFSGELKGAESFDSYRGELYTGLHGGYVVRLEDNRIVPIAKFGKKCDGIWQEDKCGRPLGLKFNDKGDLFVVDTYYGIFKVDVKTGQYKIIVNSSEPINGKIPKIPNSLDIAKNGDIYWTDSSTEFSLYDGIYTFLANPSGRLIRYNAATKKNEVLMDKLAFPNGVKLSDDESFLVILETLTSHVIKYYLKGPKAGQHEILAEALPGLPDNVYSDGQGGFLISLIAYVDAEHPMLTQSLIPHPNIRKMLARLLYLMEAPLKLLQEVYPNPYAERLMHSIGSFEAFQALDTNKISVVLRMDKSGKVLDALYSDDGRVNAVSSAYIHNGYLWLGSPFTEQVLRVPLKQAFPDLVQDAKHSTNARPKRETEPRVTKTESVKTESKPAEQAAKVSKESTVKPTTSTTPKPVTQAPTTRKPVTTTTTTTTTPKPTTTAPKPTTTTTQKPTPKPTTSAPPAAKPVQQPTKQSTKTTSTTTTTTTPKPPSASTVPPAQKPSESKKDSSKTSSNSNAKTKSSMSNAKVESTTKTKKVEENPKPNKPVQDNARDTQSGRAKTAEKNRPTDTSNAKPKH